MCNCVIGPAAAEKMKAEQELYMQQQGRALRGLADAPSGFGRFVGLETPAPAPPERPVSSMLAESVDLTLALNQRLQILLDRLSGSSPQSGQVEQKLVRDSMRSDAFNLTLQISIAHSKLNSIESAF